jgi:cytidylate kinase
VIAFITTRFGRWIAGVFAAALVFLGAMGAARRSGRLAERQKQTEAALENLRSREKIDDEVAQRGADARRRDLGRWVR